MDLKSIIGAVAPTLATMLLGPLAGTAAAALANVFGVEVDAKDTQKTIDRVTEAIQQGGMTPETIVALRQADNDHQVKLKQMEIDLEKINKDYEQSIFLASVDDRKSAREMAVKSGNTTTQTMLAVIIVVAWGLVQYQLLTGQALEPGMRELIARVLGTLDSALMCILFYYFGSSQGSNRKTEIAAVQNVEK